MVVVATKSYPQTWAMTWPNKGHTHICIYSLSLPLRQISTKNLSVHENQNNNSLLAYETLSAFDDRINYMLVAVQAEMPSSSFSIRLRIFVVSVMSEISQAMSCRIEFPIPVSLCRCCRIGYCFQRLCVCESLRFGHRRNMMMGRLLFGVFWGLCQIRC